MLQLFTSVLMVLWLLGLMTGYTMNSFIHVLPVLAIVLELIRIDIDDSEEGTRIVGSHVEE